MGIPSPAFSYFHPHKSRYAHVLQSFFNNFPGLTVAVLLTTVFFSSYLTSLHKFKNLKSFKVFKLFLKICESNTKYLRLKSPKNKAKLNLQKNYYIRQQSNKIELLKSNEIIKNTQHSLLPFPSIFSHQIQKKKTLNCIFLPCKTFKTLL